MEESFRYKTWQELSFAIVGMGLIGGSYAKALRKIGVSKIIGIDVNTEVLKMAQEQKVIDLGLRAPELALQEVDIVICAVYPNAILDFLKTAVPFLKNDVLITDVMGVKNNLPEEIQKLLTGKMEFIAGHPMAGRQGSGFSMAAAEIFDGANYIVVSAPHNSVAAIQWLEGFAKKLGCSKVVEINTEVHDRIIAYTSNLPHILAVALINSTSYDEETKHFIAGSFRDGTRVADINPNLWSELFLGNKDNVLQEIDKLKQQLERWSMALYNNDKNELQEMMRTAAEKRKDLY